MAKKKVSPIRAEYQRNIDRIKRFVRDASKRGYTFDLSNIDLTIPKRVTKKALREIKAIKPARLYQNATYKDSVSGETFTGTEGKKIENYRRNKKAANTRQARREGRQPTPAEQAPSEAPRITDIVLNNVLEMLASWAPRGQWSKSFAEWKEHDRDIARNIIEGAISTDGRDAVAKRLEENAARVTALIDNILYGSGDKESKSSGRDSVQFNLVELSAIVKGRGLTQSESMEVTEASEENDFLDELT